MPTPRPLRTPPAGGPAPLGPPALGDRALDNLRFIRATMERATAFTAISGRGQVAMGLTALAATLVAARQTSAAAWTATWLAEAALALAIALCAMRRKARRTGDSLLAAPARRFAHGFVPPVAAGALLTLALYRGGLVAALPGTWLLLFGAGVATGGACSVRVVPATGLLFMLLGTVALLGPAAWGDALMALGFGGLHIACGLVVARRHGG